MGESASSEKSPLVANENFENVEHLSESYNNNTSGRNADTHQNPKQQQQRIGDSKDVEKPKIRFSQMSRRSKIILILCTTANFLFGSATSIIGPLFPNEAEKKGMPVTVIGFVIGLFALLIFISSPIYGNFLTKIGPKFCYLTGLLVGGVSTILFGTLDQSPVGTPFIAITIACRSVKALGFAGFLTANFAIISSEFPDNVGFVYGITELGTGLGHTIGPSIGGALFELGGYGLPFYVLGSFVLVDGCLIYAFLPTVQLRQDSKKREKYAFIYLLRSPLVIISMFSVICGSIGMGLYSSTIAKHAKPFHLSTGIFSLYFSIVAVVNAVMSAVWGYITDRKDTRAPLIIGGHLFFGIGLLMVGPSQLLPFLPYKLWSMAIGMVLIGFSFGCTLIPTMKCMLKGAYSLGFGNSNMETNAILSGLLNSAHQAGFFIGPFGGDALISAKGYPFTYTVAGLLHIFAMLLQITFYSTRYILGKRRRNLEMQERTILKNGERRYGSSQQVKSSSSHSV